MKVWQTILLLLLTFSILLILSSPLAAKENPLNWSYSGKGNPNQWGSLQADFVTCDLGKYQSPINISNAVTGNPANIQFNYLSTPLNIINNGRTIQVNYQKGSMVIIDGNKYELLQFHFHIPAEHAIENQKSAMELHLVHRNLEGKIAVIGIAIAKGKANSTIEKIWQNIPQEKGYKLVKDLQINAAKLLPRKTSYFSYIGSLTTPPCTEDVSWNILDNPIYVSEAQIAKFKSVYQVNARPMRSLNNRVIEFHESVTKFNSIDF